MNAKSVTKAAVKGAFALALTGSILTCGVSRPVHADTFSNPFYRPSDPRQLNTVTNGVDEESRPAPSPSPSASPSPAPVCADPQMYGPGC